MNRPRAHLFLSTAEAADMIGISPASLNRLRRRNDGPPAVRINSRVFLFSRDEVFRWLQERTAGVSVPRPITRVRQSISKSSERTKQ